MEKQVRTVIVSGAETDVCVLSTVLDAVNFGFRVVLVEDALCSSSDVGHDALMTMYRTRFNEQIDLVEARRLRDIWRPTKANRNLSLRSSVVDGKPKESAMAEKDLQELFLDTLKDIYYAEKHILKALPKMAKAANSEQLKAAFEKHHDETEGQVDRLEKIFDLL